MEGGTEGWREGSGAKCRDRKVRQGSEEWREGQRDGGIERERSPV